MPTLRLIGPAPTDASEETPLFSWETLRSKTFWGAVALGVLSALAGLGYDVPEWLFGIIAAFTGVSLADRQTKVLAAVKGDSADPYREF